LVSVVTSTRSSRSVRARISPIRSSICPWWASPRPRVDQSGRADDLLDELAAGLASSYGPGVADRYTV
jgi:hypothetical protein